MKLSHVGIPVTDIARSRAFYERALAPLGMKVLMEMSPDHTESGGTAIGFAKDDQSDSFWIGDNEKVGEGVHVAFEVDSREQVDAFHKAALAAGGKDNGAPGLRPHYAPNYYAAFVYDPDGANIEALCLNRTDRPYSRGVGGGDSCPSARWSSDDRGCWPASHSPSATTSSATVRFRELT